MKQIFLILILCAAHCTAYACYDQEDDFWDSFFEAFYSAEDDFWIDSEDIMSFYDDSDMWVVYGPNVDYDYDYDYDSDYGSVAESYDDSFCEDGWADEDDVEDEYESQVLKFYHGNSVSREDIHLFNPPRPVLALGIPKQGLNQKTCFLHALAYLLSISNLSSSYEEIFKNVLGMVDKYQRGNAASIVYENGTFAAIVDYILGNNFDGEDINSPYKQLQGNDPKFMCGYIDVNYLNLDSNSQSKNSYHAIDILGYCDGSYLVYNPWYNELVSYDRVVIDAAISKGDAHFLAIPMEILDDPKYKNRTRQ